MTRAARRPRRATSHARKSGPPLRRRLRIRVPGQGRILALALLFVLVGGLMALVNAPGLRVAQIAWAGQRYTPGYQLERILGPLRGSSLLTVNGSALQRELEVLPSVATARVEAEMPDRLQVTLTEKPAAFVWRTIAVQMVCAADGTVIGQVALRLALPADLAGLPFIDDRRKASREVLIGDRLDADEVHTATRLAALEPAMLGSASADLRIAIDDDHGFMLIGGGIGWKAALGRLQAVARSDGLVTDPVEAAVAAIRTLFSIESEEKVSWVDVRNPGKVYWRP